VEPCDCYSPGELFARCIRGPTKGEPKAHLVVAGIFLLLHPPVSILLRSQVRQIALTGVRVPDFTLYQV